MKSHALKISLSLLLSIFIFSAGLTLSAGAALQEGRQAHEALDASSVGLQTESDFTRPVKKELQASIQTRVSSQAALGVVGVEFWLPEGLAAYPRISNVFPDSPAQEAGLYLGDWLLAIDGQPCKGWSRHRLDVAISDIPGTVHHLLVFRKGQALLTMQLQVTSLLSVSPRLRQHYASP